MHQKTWPLAVSLSYTIFIFEAFLFIAEVIYRLVDNPETCKDSHTTYGYCANFGEGRDVSRDIPGAHNLRITIDELGGPQPPDQTPVYPADAAVFVIGDSFIKADELPYEQTLCGLMNPAGIPTMLCVIRQSGQKIARWQRTSV
jgi:hypothetical protein